MFVVGEVGKGEAFREGSSLGSRRRVLISQTISRDQKLKNLNAVAAVAAVVAVVHKYILKSVTCTRARAYV